MSKYWHLKKTEVSFKLAFVSTDNLVQNILKKLRKQANLDNLDTCFSHNAKNLFLQERLSTRLCPHAVLRFS